MAFIMLSCQSARVKEENRRLADNPAFIKNQFIVRFSDEHETQKVIDRFAHYDLKVFQEIDVSRNTYVLTFDTLKVSPARMKIKLEDIPAIDMLEYNKKLTLRKRN